MRCGASAPGGASSSESRSRTIVRRASEMSLAVEVALYCALKVFCACCSAALESVSVDIGVEAVGADWCVTGVERAVLGPSMGSIVSGRGELVS